MIFDIVIRPEIKNIIPSCKMARNVLPTIPVDFVKLEKSFFLVTVPGLLIDAWVEVIVPPLSALLARAHGD